MIPSLIIMSSNLNLIKKIKYFFSFICFLYQPTNLLCYGFPPFSLRENITSAKEVMFSPGFVCLSVCLSDCQQHNSKSYGRIWMRFSGNVHKMVSCLGGGLLFQFSIKFSLYCHTTKVGRKGEGSYEAWLIVISTFPELQLSFFYVA